MILFEKYLQFLIIKRILIISEAENIWFVCKKYFIWIRDWTKNYSIRKSWSKNIFDTNFFRISWLSSFESSHGRITSNNSYHSISEFSRFAEVILMTRVKSVKCPKSHYQHSLLMVGLSLLYIHRRMSFFLCNNFFFILIIQLEKFFLKYFFKKCFLWANEEIDKNTKWCEKKYQ